MYEIHVLPELPLFPHAFTSSLPCFNKQIISVRRQLAVPFLSRKVTPSATGASFGNSRSLYLGIRGPRRWQVRQDSAPHQAIMNATRALRQTAVQSRTPLIHFLGKRSVPGESETLPSRSSTTSSDAGMQSQLIMPLMLTLPHLHTRCLTHLQPIAPRHNNMAP